MANFQYIPYTLIAVGLINAVYKHNDSGAISKSLILIIFGAILFLASRVGSIKALLDRNISRVIILVVGTLLILSTLK